ncbi:transient receptor potential cation channel subfamily M member 7 isoform X1 [Electrophorus electricus]|uniref:transient receptor potential cation channel subfamily M member 7 isoform X1 n=1 Tax=Electrophorus electricus TaxID=8005 RepID=UPI0015D0CE4E|nr:transient receptor potential cation channel subfamily M member 7 isoform X1 [Electrophorus electricus]
MFLYSLLPQRDEEDGDEFKLESQKSWIENTFTKRECVYILPVSKDPHRCLPGCQICQQLVRCCCGRLVRQHVGFTASLAMKYSDVKLAEGVELGPEQEEWSVEKHTEQSPTDAYGVINFQGGSHSYRAKYVRLSHDSRPEAILRLMLREWQMELPKIVISVHGGIQNFDLHPRIKQVVGKGLIKAAVTTGAWILTGGVNTGVAKHVGDALKEHSSRSARKICTIGIAPWGVIENRTDLIGRDVVAPYQTLLNPLSKLNVLNNLHSHFILVDDGTVGKYGAEVNLRRELEKHINLQRIHARIGQGVPVVALIFEGGPNVILTVLEYLQESPPVPVVVCEGTGRAADILSYVHKQTEDDGGLPDGVEIDILATIKKTFNFSHNDAVHLFHTLMECMKNKDLITVFHVGSEDHQDIDVAILKALLKGTDASAFDQLVLTLAWNRVDIAKDHVFVYGQKLLVDSLEQAMLDALVMDRVDFVKLLIENGVSMHRFLTISHLEELYNTKLPTNHTLFQLVRDVKQGNLPPNYKITLIDVGLVIEYLMGGTYRCNYTRKRFRIIYNNLHGSSRRSGRTQPSGPSLRKTHEAFSMQADKKEKTRHNHFIKTAQPYKPKLESSSDLQQKRSKEEVVDIDDPETRRFPYPFNELLVWAVLMKRQKMALFFWQHGEESMAKALVACRLCRAMCYEAKKSDVVDDTSEELKKYSNEFGRLAVDLLEQSFRQDETMAMKLLTYELKNWSNSTCLKLAVSSRLRPFVAHTCTQMLLSDMWMGRLNMRKNSWYKVILSILVFPAILMLEYKSKAEMAHIPQDAHQVSMEDSDHNLQRADDIPMDVFKEARMNEHVEINNEAEVLMRSRRLPITRKFHAFYLAPIVKFWTNTLFYLGFLMLYSYVVLVRLPLFPSPQEWVVILYIFTSAIEKIREMFMSEGGKISQKIKVWFSDYFNISDFIAIIMFFVGFGLRFGSGKVFIAGRIVYCLNIIFWYVRLLDFLAVNQQAGPYVMMIGKMVANMFYIVVIMFVVLVTYGVPRKAILYPNSDAEWSLIIDVLFQPYWMMYGEVYAYEIDVCSNSSENPVKSLCASGVWLTPALQAVYLFIQYILMVNLLIAFFNNVYLQVMSMSNLVWKYQRYHFIMAYHDKPVLPPPLIIFCHMASFLNFLCKRRKKDSSAYGPKLFLTEEDQKKLHDFEEQCVETYFHEKDDKFHSGSEERIRLTSDRVETMSIQLKEVGNRVNFIKRSLHSLDSQIGHLQDLSALTVDTLKALTAQRASDASKVHNQITRELSLSKNLVPGVVDPLPPSKASVLPQRSIYPPPGHMADSLFGGRANEGAGLTGEIALSPEKRPLFTPEAGSSGSALEYTHEHAHTHVQLGSGSPPEKPVGQNNTSRKDSSLPKPPDAMATFFVSTPTQPVGLRAHTLTHAVQTEQPHTSVEFGAFVGHKDDPEDQRLFLKDTSAGCRQLSPSRKDSAEGHLRTVNSYAGFTELDRTPAFLHPEFSLSKQEKSRVSAEDVVFHEDPRATLLLERAQGKSVQAISSLTAEEEASKGERNSEHVHPNPAPVGMYSARHTPLGARKDSIGSPFKPMEGYQYSAVERNNLMRLSQSIPFTPVPPRGEPVTVYRLEESSPNSINNSMSSWAQRGLCAKIEFLSKEEMGGGLRRALKVLCTWSEYDVLKPGHLYIVKSFLPEVINTWKSVYKEDTVLHLCLREIQQQRAAQKLTFAFNQIRPKTIPYSPRFLEVFLLYCHSAGQWFAIEECITGEFRKFNNNNGDEIVPTNLLEETMLAFSHWTYEFTRGELLVLDLQGVGEILTDPSVIKSGEKGLNALNSFRSYDMVFGPANLGDDAIRNFRTKHHCNSCCRKLKLPDLKRNDYTPEKVTLQQDDQTEGSSPSPPAGGSTKEPRQSMRLML